MLLHKIRGAMHDTCATANLTATLMQEKRNTSGQLRYGYDEWETLAKEHKPWCDFLCGNHVRNLVRTVPTRTFGKGIGDNP